MGYIPKKTTYKLDFAGTEQEGLEVQLRALDTGQMLDLTELIEQAESDAQARNALFLLLAEQLVSWNVETEDGAPVPATIDGVRAQEPAFNNAIINAWQEAMAGVPTPLPHGSPSGEPALVASIPTETLSPSHPSYAMPA